MDSKLLAKLEKRENEGTLRYLSIFDSEIDFFSNDYLGLAKENIHLTTKVSGATGSRLLSGNSEQADKCEVFLADFFNSKAALVFNSGYSANLALLSSVPQRGDTIIYDELVHASIRDGIRLSFANSISFKHNDSKDLKKQIESSNGSIYIIVESLYSMNGDLCPLKSIIDLSEEFKAYLIVDEAHSVGVFGNLGRGVVDSFSFQDKVFARIITFGKAYGFHGAAILGSIDLKNYLINFARPFIYTTGLPSQDYDIITLKVKSNSRKRQESLHENIRYFRNEFLDPQCLPSELNSPIQIIQTNSIEETIKLADRMKAAGIYTKPIFSPTVLKGKECIRICLHSFNTREEIDLLKSLI